MEINKNEFQTSIVARSALETGIAYAERYVSRAYMSNLSAFDVLPVPITLGINGKPIDEYADIRLYRLAKLVLNKEENVTDKLASVYGAIHSIGSALLVVVKSSIDGIEFFIGTKKNRSSDISPATAGQILKGTLKSNFPGSNLIDINSSEIESLLCRVN